MKIDKRLNIVVEVENEEGRSIFVHATPISNEIFEKYFMVIAQAFSAINGENMGVAAGPRIAALMLQKVAQDAGVWDTPGGVQQGLIEEIKRLAVAVVPTEKGWDSLPLDSAIKGELISPEDVSEVMNILVFFTVSSAMHRRTVLSAVLKVATLLWGAQITSQNSTEFKTSLPTSTATVNSGEKAAGLSLPS